VAMALRGIAPLLIVQPTLRVGATPGVIVMDKAVEAVPVELEALSSFTVVVGTTMGSMLVAAVVVALFMGTIRQERLGQMVLVASVMEEAVVTGALLVLLALLVRAMVLEPVAQAVPPEEPEAMPHT